MDPDWLIGFAPQTFGADGDDKIRIKVLRPFKEKVFPVSFLENNLGRDFYNVPQKFRPSIATLAFLWSNYPDVCEAYGAMKILNADKLADYLEQKGYPWTWLFEHLEEVLISGQYTGYNEDEANQHNPSKEG